MPSNSAGGHGVVPRRGCSRSRGSCPPRRRRCPGAPIPRCGSARWRGYASRSVAFSCGLRTLRVAVMTSDVLTRHAAEIERAGYTVFERVIEPELVGDLLQVIDRVMADARIPFGANRFLGEHTRRIFNLLARDPLFARVPLHPAVLPLVERVLDEQCLLSSLTAIEMHPGQARATVPRRRRLDRAAASARPGGVRRALGTDRLRLGQRRHPAGAGIAPPRAASGQGRARGVRRSRDARRQCARVRRLALARRRRQRQR